METSKLTKAVDWNDVPLHIGDYVIENDMFILTPSAGIITNIYGAWITVQINKKLLTRSSAVFFKITEAEYMLWMLENR